MRPLQRVAVVGGLVGAGLLAVGLAVAARDGDGDGAAGPARVIGLGIEVVPVEPGDGPAFGQAFGRARVGFDGPCGDVLVAETPAQRNQGLRGVADLGTWDGMLFVRDVPGAGSFTMAGTAMDLTVGWYDAEGSRLGTADMEVCVGTDQSCPSYPSPGPWSFAVEYPLGALPEGDLTAC